MIKCDRRAHFEQPETRLKTLEVTPWLLWFGETFVKAQQATLERVAFFISRARYYDGLWGRLSGRQSKVIQRMFREEREGFRVGSVPRTISPSRATATRDLQDVVEMGAITRTGERCHTSYWLQNA